MSEQTPGPPPKGGISEKLVENKTLLLAVGTLLLLSNVPYGNYLLYPFKLFSTWIHETCHGLAALAVGGEFRALYVYSDTSGQALNAIPQGALNRTIVASAGYLGTTLFGALLLLLQRPTRFSKGVAAGSIIALLLIGFTQVQPYTGIAFFVALASMIGVLAFFTPAKDIGRVGTFAFGVLMLFTLLYARSVFTLAFVAVLGLAFLGIAIRMPGDVSRFTFSFLAATCGLNALTSIKELFSPNLVVNGQKAAQSDAHAVANALFGSSGMWAALWLAFSVVVLGWAFFRAITAPTLVLKGLDDEDEPSKPSAQPLK